MSEELTGLAQIGPATASVLAATDIRATDITERRVSHEQLLEAGVNPGVAARIRREHSLPWSLEGGGEDLDRRAEQVRGLRDGEREWVAASSDGWVEPAESDTAESEPTETEWERRPWPTESPSESFEAEAEWRERSRPTPTTALAELDAESVSQLAEAGITSVGRLATCDPERVADSLGITASTVREWQAAARKLD